MIGKEDLGLSLSLSSPSAHFSTTQLNLMPSSSSSSPSPGPTILPFSTGLSRPASQWNDMFIAPTRIENNRPLEIAGGSVFRGIDMNEEAEREGEEEEPAASSPNSTVSSVSGKRGERDVSHGDVDGLENERASSRGLSDDEDGEGSRKKLRLSKDQSAILEESFKEHSTLNPKQKMALAKQLNLRPRQVEVWFQNRRARTKLKQTEVDCEFLKRCCENLSEENRRLQKEVQELRALKLSPQLYMHMTPPTTLTMCPSCERVSNSTSTNNPSTPISAVSASAHHRQYLQNHPIAIRTTFVHGPQRS